MEQLIRIETGNTCEWGSVRCSCRCQRQHRAERGKIAINLIRCAQKLEGNETSWHIHLRHISKTTKRRHQSLGSVGFKLMRSDESRTEFAPDLTQNIFLFFFPKRQQCPASFRSSATANVYTNNYFKDLKEFLHFLFSNIVQLLSATKCFILID